jgi:hypothetical protein
MDTELVQGKPVMLTSRSAGTAERDMPLATTIPRARIQSRSLPGARCDNGFILAITIDLADPLSLGKSRVTEEAADLPRYAIATCSDGIPLAPAG